VADALPDAVAASLVSLCHSARPSSASTATAHGSGEVVLRATPGARGCEGVVAREFMRAGRAAQAVAGRLLWPGLAEASFAASALAVPYTAGTPALTVCQVDWISAAT